MVVLSRFFVTLRFQINALFSAVRMIKQWMCQFESVDASTPKGWDGLPAFQ
jgi:hypothetical protein